MEHVGGPLTEGELTEAFEPADVGRNMVEMRELVDIALELHDVRVLNDRTVAVEDFNEDWSRHLVRVLDETRAR